MAALEALPKQYVLSLPSWRLSRWKRSKSSRLAPQVLSQLVAQRWGHSILLFVWNEHGRQLFNKISRWSWRNNISHSLARTTRLWRYLRATSPSLRWRMNSNSEAAWMWELFLQSCQPRPSRTWGLAISSAVWLSHKTFLEKGWWIRLRHICKIAWSEKKDPDDFDESIFNLDKGVMTLTVFVRQPVSINFESLTLTIFDCPLEILVHLERFHFWFITKIRHNSTFAILLHSIYIFLIKASKSYPNRKFEMYIVRTSQNNDFEISRQLRPKHGQDIRENPNSKFDKEERMCHPDIYLIFQVIKATRRCDMDKGVAFDLTLW